MAINAQGIYEWEGDETFPEWRDDLTASITATVADLNSDIAGIAVPADTGWVNISTFGTGWTATSAAYQPRVRKVGNRVDLAGAVTRTTTTGLATNILTIPSGFRLAGAYNTYFVGTVVTAGGQVQQLRLVNGTHILDIPSGYASAALGSGTVLPLIGTWYVD